MENWSITMKKILALFIGKLFSIIGYQKIKKLILLLAKYAGIDLLLLAYNDMGIFKYQNEYVSGENFLIKSFLKQKLQKNNPIIFDVGANIGKYSKNLISNFPEAYIYAFEPNPNTFEILNFNFSNTNTKNYLKLHNLGLSSKLSSRKLYTYRKDRASEHASIHKDVLLELHGDRDIVAIDFKTTTLDIFCEQNNIDFIDFLKIDTEGHEFEVLQGSKRMLSEKKISIIQFEFNEMNIVTNVFLKDFYKLLKGYQIYRLDSDRLIPLPKYSSRNEIFQFQNFVAIQT